jgi:endonuclease YncB( thermonuclease family)
MLAVAVLLTLAFGQTGWLSSEQGRFTAIDGDSLRKGAQEYRLHGIDAPELNQNCAGSSGTPYPCGRKARDQLSRLVTGATLDCDVLDRDRYSRLVVACRTGQLDINREMVRSGWAVAYHRHGTDYEDSQSAAKDARRGIWQGAFENPERWRAQRRSKITLGDISGVLMPDD